jgi:hypothetical protein
LINRKQITSRPGRDCLHKLLAVFVLPASLLSSAAQENPNPAPLPNAAVCPLCAATRYYREEGKVKAGLSVDMLVGPAQVNEPVTLRFFVNQKPTNWPEENLELEHEKFIHVIGVRDDLQEFFHIHPVKTGPGTWTVTRIFTNGGNYKIWSDVRCRGISYTFGHPTLRVSGSSQRSDRNHSLQDCVAASGYRITLKHSEPLMTGRTNELQFTIRDASGSDIETENFLGAPMHLVMIRDDLSVYVHAHPDSPGDAAPQVHFSQVFTGEGTYKLFAQFRPAKTKLPPDEAIVAEFYVNVERPRTDPAIPETKQSQ